MKYFETKNNLHCFINNYNKTNLQKKIIFNTLFIKFVSGGIKKRVKNKLVKNFKYLRILNLK